MIQQLQEEFKVRIFDVDAHQHLSIPSLINYMQELAWQHSIEHKVSIYELLPMGFSWVLSRMKVIINRLPQHGEAFFVKTWIVNNDKFFCYRDFLVTDAQGQTLAKGSSIWGILDINRRRIIAVPEYIASKFIYDDYDRTPQIQLSQKLIPPQGADFEQSFQVRYSDIDINNHVNNMLYFQWVVETFSVEWLKTHFLKEIDLTFRMESAMGDTIDGKAQKAIDQDNTFLHKLSNQHAKDLVMAKTTWEDLG